MLRPHNYLRSVFAITPILFLLVGCNYAELDQCQQQDVTQEVFFHVIVEKNDTAENDGEVWTYDILSSESEVWEDIEVTEKTPTSVSCSGILTAHVIGMREAQTTYSIAHPEMKTFVEQRTAEGEIWSDIPNGIEVQWKQKLMRKVSWTVQETLAGTKAVTIKELVRLGDNES